MELNKSERFISQLIKNNEVIYSGNIAYGRIDSQNPELSKMIRGYEYPVYGYGIVFPNADKSTKEANKNTYWQRVPEFDITTEEISTVR